MVTITADALTVSIPVPNGLHASTLTDLQAGLIELIRRSACMADYTNYNANGCFIAACDLLEALQPTEQQAKAYLLTPEKKGRA